MVESDTEGPEAGRVLNNWFSLLGVCGLLGELSWFPNSKPREMPSDSETSNGASGCPWILTDACLDGELGEMGVRETGLLPVVLNVKLEVRVIGDLPAMEA